MAAIKVAFNQNPPSLTLLRLSCVFQKSASTAPIAYQVLITQSTCFYTPVSVVTRETANGHATVRPLGRFQTKNLLTLKLDRNAQGPRRSSAVHPGCCRATPFNSLITPFFGCSIVQPSITPRCQPLPRSARKASFLMSTRWRGEWNILERHLLAEAGTGNSYCSCFATARSMRPHSWSVVGEDETWLPVVGYEWVCL